MSTYESAPFGSSGDYVLSGSVSFNSYTKLATAGTYPIPSSTTIVGIDTATPIAPITVTLYSATVAAIGTIVVLKDEGGAANTDNITINPAGSETIDGAATIGITVNYGSVALYSDGSNWFIYARGLV